MNPVAQEFALMSKNSYTGLALSFFFAFFFMKKCRQKISSYANLDFSKTEKLQHTLHETKMCSKREDAEAADQHNTFFVIPFISLGHIRKIFMSIYHLSNLFTFYVIFS